MYNNNNNNVYSPNWSRVYKNKACMQYYSDTSNISQ